MYTIGEAAFYVGVPPVTLHQWLYGRDYKAKGEIRSTEPVILPADGRRGLLSFANLSEAHVLSAIRKQRFSLSEIREAVQVIAKTFPHTEPHPLIGGEFYRNGKDLMIRVLNDTINVSRPRQGQRLLDKDVFDPYLQRIVRDDKDLPVRLFPMRANPDARIMVDLFIASGQPVISDTGILAEFIHERHKFGETAEEIAEDYGIDVRAVADAIRYVEAA